MTDGDFMEYLIKFQLNIYAVLVLVILLIAILKKSRIVNLGRQLFLTTIFLCIAVIIIEPLTWIFDGMHFYGAYFLEYLTNVLLILIAPILCGLMVSYVDYYIFKDRDRLKKRFFYLTPTIFTVIMLIINIFHPIYFYVDREFVGYHVEDFLWIQYVMIIGYYLFMILFTLKHRKKTYNYVVWIFLVFFSLPIIGMLLQLIFVNLFFSWTAIGLSLLVIYFFLESTTGEKDYLTKLYSRRSYEKYVNHLIDGHRDFSILFLDLDDFKLVNDTKGHFAGDQVLISFARLLEKVFYPNTMVSRLAGDEFIVVLEHPMDIETSVNHIYHLIENHNNQLLKSLKFSFGHQDYQESMSIDELYVSVDRLMYQHKNQKIKTTS